jgi:light-regulated signal transduction histidine kinase (bacteriophytochrome)
VIGSSFDRPTGEPTPDELARRLERERKARHRAEEIAESATRELYAAIQELKLTNAELDRRVEQRTAEVLAAYRELELFSSSVSHDLRSPLRAIDGFSQILLEDYGDQLDGTSRGFVERISGAARRMDRLIDALLGLSRVSRAPVRVQEVDLTAAARDIAADLQQGEPERIAQFLFADNLVVQGDPDLLRDVLQNLLNNAWKFTRGRPQTTITFDFTERDGQPVYYVRDNGVGFDPSYADRLFRAFERLHDPTEFEGDGIGLATVQRVLARHGGEIWADGAIDGGATFYFTIGEPVGSPAQ